MPLLFTLSLIMLYGILSNYTSFLRVLMLLEVLLLVTSLFLVSFLDGSEAASTGGSISALVVLTLAGTEAAIGLSLLILLNVSLCTNPGR